MAFDNTNRGVLFKNERKGMAGANPSLPDYTGNINVNGEEFWLSGWVKTAGPGARNPGQKFLSVAVTSREESQSPKAEANYDDSDIPF